MTVLRPALRAWADRNSATARENGMNTPDTTERRGGIKGRSAPGERTGDSRLQPLNLDISPKPLADETRRGSAALGGLPLSDVGLDDPACRGAEGGPK